MTKGELIEKLKVQLEECMVLISPDAQVSRVDLARLFIRLEEAMSFEMRQGRLGGVGAWRVTSRPRLTGSCV